MVVIRLTRVGKKNSPSYRVVVADQRKAVKRKFIEVIGFYNPTQNPKLLQINAERANFWMSNGAKPSDTVNNLMVDLKILSKDSKINKIYGKKTKKKAQPDAPKPEIKAEETKETDEKETPKEEIAKTEVADTADIEENPETTEVGAPAEDPAPEIDPKEAEVKND